MKMAVWIRDRLVDLGHAINGAIRNQKPELADKLENAYRDVYHFLVTRAGRRR